jgi:AcrR family transcriptional regulator
VRILDAATRCFAAAGFDGAPSAELARSAGVSEGTLFHHFPTKRALLEAVAERGARAVLDAAFAGVDPDRDAPDLEPIARRLLAFARKRSDLYRVFRMSRACASQEPGQPLAAGEERIVAAIADALARWSARGLLRPLPPHIAAELVFAQFDAVVCHCVLRGHREDEDACVRELVRSLTGALTNPS